MRKLFSQLKEIPSTQWYRYAMDGHFQQKANHLYDWEMREPGSNAAVLDAYAVALNNVLTKQPYTKDDILSIHKACVKKVGNLQLGSENFRSARHDVYFFMGLSNLHNASEAGLREFAAYCIRENDYSMFPEDYRQILKDPQNLPLTEIKLTDLLMTEMRKKPLKYSAVVPTDETGEQIASLVQETLNHLYQHLQTTTDTDEKLKYIVIAIQRLERIHPFSDANCRTLCLVLLNGLLMQQDLLPALIENPNRFDGYSIDELILMIKEGMEKTASLIQKKNISSAPSGVDENTQAAYAENLTRKIAVLTLIEELHTCATQEEKDTLAIQKIDSAKTLLVFLKYFFDMNQPIPLTANCVYLLFNQFFPEKGFALPEDKNTITLEAARLLYENCFDTLLDKIQTLILKVTPAPDHSMLSLEAVVNEVNQLMESREKEGSPCCSEDFSSVFETLFHYQKYNDETIITEMLKFQRLIETISDIEKLADTRTHYFGLNYEQRKKIAVIKLFMPGIVEKVTQDIKNLDDFQSIWGVHGCLRDFHRMFDNEEWRLIERGSMNRVISLGLIKTVENFNEVRCHLKFQSTQEEFLEKIDFADLLKKSDSDEKKALIESFESMMRGKTTDERDILLTIIKRRLDETGDKEILRELQHSEILSPRVAARAGTSRHAFFTTPSDHTPPLDDTPAPSGKNHTP